MIQRFAVGLLWFLQVFGDGLADFAETSRSYTCKHYTIPKHAEAVHYGPLKTLVGEPNVIKMMAVDPACADYDTCMKLYGGDLGRWSYRAWTASFGLLGFIGLWLLSFQGAFRKLQRRFVEWTLSVLAERAAWMWGLSIFVVLATLLFLYRDPGINGVNAGFCGLSVFLEAIERGNADDFIGLRETTASLSKINETWNNPDSEFWVGVNASLTATAMLPTSLEGMSAVLEKLETITQDAANVEAGGSYYECVLCRVVVPYVVPVYQATLENVATALSAARSQAKSFVEGDAKTVVQQGARTVARIANRVTSQVKSASSTIDGIGKGVVQLFDVITATCVSLFFTITFANVFAHTKILSAKYARWVHRIIPQVTIFFAFCVFSCGVLLLFVAYIGGSTCEVLREIPVLFVDMEARFSSEEVVDGVIDVFEFCVAESGSFFTQIKVGDKTLAQTIDDANVVVDAFDQLALALADSAKAVSLEESAPVTSLVEAVETLGGVYLQSSSAYGALEISYPPSVTDLASLTPSEIAELYLSDHISSTLCDTKSLTVEIAQTVLSGMGISFANLDIPGVDEYLGDLQNKGISVGIASCETDLDITSISGSRKTPWGDLLQLKKDVRLDTFRCFTSQDAATGSDCSFSDIVALVQGMGAEISQAASYVDQAKDASVEAVNVTLRTLIFDDIIYPLQEIADQSNCTFVKELWSETVTTLCDVGFPAVFADAHVVIWIGIFLATQFFLFGALFMKKVETAETPQQI